MFKFEVGDIVAYKEGSNGVYFYDTGKIVEIDNDKGTVIKFSKLDPRLCVGSYFGINDSDRRYFRVPPARHIIFLFRKIKE